MEKRNLRTLGNELFTASGEKLGTVIAELGCTADGALSVDEIISEIRNVDEEFPDMEVSKINITYMITDRASSVSLYETEAYGDVMQALIDGKSAYIPKDFLDDYFEVTDYDEDNKEGKYILYYDVVNDMIRYHVTRLNIIQIEDQVRRQALVNGESCDMSDSEYWDDLAYRMADYERSWNDRRERLLKKVISNENVLLSFIYYDDVKIDSSLKQDLAEQMDKMLNTLSHYESEIIRLRFGLKDGHSRSIAETAAELKLLVPEYVYDIELRAIRKLRHPSRGGRLRKLMLIKQLKQYEDFLDECEFVLASGMCDETFTKAYNADINMYSYWYKGATAELTDKQREKILRLAEQENITLKRFDKLVFTEEELEDYRDMKDAFSTEDLSPIPGEEEMMRKLNESFEKFVGNKN